MTKILPRGTESRGLLRASRILGRWILPKVSCRRNEPRLMGNPGNWRVWIFKLKVDESPFQSLYSASLWPSSSRAGTSPRTLASSPVRDLHPKAHRPRLVKPCIFFQALKNGTRFLASQRALSGHKLDPDCSGGAARCGKRSSDMKPGAIRGSRGQWPGFQDVTHGAAVATITQPDRHPPLFAHVVSYIQILDIN